EGKRLCVRIYRRSDGTVITKDCPVGLRAARLQVVRMLTAVAGIFLFGCVSALGMFGRNRQRAADTSAGALLERWSRPDPDPALAAEIDALIRAEMSRATIGSVAESGVMAEIDLDNQPQVQPHDR
ncbi:MAG: hypothetical protein QF805_15410, partial [Pirellulaceae bacterium]|nr:hypothetical protein [Pirellulaceae bacterium]